MTFSSSCSLSVLHRSSLFTHFSHYSHLCDTWVSHHQTTGNVWVTHEEMETLAATPPTVSLPWLAGCWWLLASVVTLEARSKLPSQPPDLIACLLFVTSVWFISPLLIRLHGLSQATWNKILFCLVVCVFLSFLLPLVVLLSPSRPYRLCVCVCVCVCVCSCFNIS